MTPGRAVDELVAASSTGDANAWDALVARFAPLIWAVARGHGLDVSTAVDVAQTCWLRFAEHLGEIEPDAVGVWLATTARQESRRAARWVVHVDLTVASGESAGGTIWQAMASLPPRCRLALRLLALQDEPSDAELAAALDVSVESVAAVVAQCVERLGHRLTIDATDAVASPTVAP